MTLVFNARSCDTSFEIFDKTLTWPLCWTVDLQFISSIRTVWIAVTNQLTGETAHITGELTDQTLYNRTSPAHVTGELADETLYNRTSQAHVTGEVVDQALHSEMSLLLKKSVV